MKTIELNVSYDKLFKDDEDVRTVEGSRNYTQIHFNFLTDDWKNVKMKVVYFEYDNGKTDAELVDTDNMVTIPSRVLALQYFKVSLKGYTETIDQLIPTNKVDIVVDSTIEPNTDIPTENKYILRSFYEVAEDNYVMKFLRNDGTTFELSLSNIKNDISSKADPTKFDLTYDVDNGVVNLTYNNEVIGTVDFGEKLVLESATYDKNTKSIILKFTSGDIITIPVSDLSDIYKGGTTETTTVTMTDENEIKVEINEAYKVKKSDVDNKVDKVTGKQLSTNDFTNELKTKLDGISEGANKVIVDSELSSTSENPVQNKVIKSALDETVKKIPTKLSQLAQDSENYWSLTGGTTIGENTDLNTIIAIGNYRCKYNDKVATLVNKPSDLDSAFVMKVYQSYGTTNYLTQEIICSTKKYSRVFSVNVSKWTPWNLLSDILTTYVKTSVINNKLDKVTTSSNHSQAYAKTPGGGQVMWNMNNTPGEDTIPLFDSNKNLKTSTPVADNDTTPKVYVDEKVNNVNTNVEDLTQELNELKEQINGYLFDETEVTLNDVDTAVIPKTVQVGSSTYNVADNSRAGVVEIQGKSNVAHVCNMIEVDGKSVKFNQLVDKTKFKDTVATQGITFTIDKTKGTITVNGTNTESTSLYFNPLIGSTSVNVISGHKYLLKGSPTNASTTTTFANFYGDGIIYVFDTGLGAIVQATSSGLAFLQIIIAANATVSNAVFTPQLYDLTAMGLDDISLTDFNKKFPSTPYEYNSGELKHVAISEVTARALNMIDKSKIQYTTTSVQGVTVTTNKEKGTVTINGTNSSSTTAIIINLFAPRNQMHIVNGHKYLIKGSPSNSTTSTAYLRLFSTNIITLDTSNSMSIGTANSTGIATIHLIVREGVTVSNMTFQPQVFDLTAYYGAGNEPTSVANVPFANDGKYHEYFSETLTLSSPLTLRGIDDIYCDKLYLQGDNLSSGVALRRFAEVDLGTLTWVAATESNTFYSSGNSWSLPIKKGTNYILCSNYSSLPTTTVVANMTDKSIICAVDGIVYVKDSSYTDVATFKTAMSGVKLVYELATKTSEAITTGGLTNNKEEIFHLLDTNTNSTYGMLDREKIRYGKVKNNTVSSLTFKGKNLFDKENIEVTANLESRIDAYTLQSDGRIFSKYTVYNQGYQYITLNNLKKGTYTLSANIDLNNSLSYVYQIVILDNNQQVTLKFDITDNPLTVSFTLPYDISKLGIALQPMGSASENRYGIYISNLQVEVGSTPTSYSEYRTPKAVALPSAQELRSAKNAYDTIEVVKNASGLFDMNKVQRIGTYTFTGTESINGNSGTYPENSWYWGGTQQWENTPKTTGSQPLIDVNGLPLTTCYFDDYKSLIILFSSSIKNWYPEVSSLLKGAILNYELATPTTTSIATNLTLDEVTAIIEANGLVTVNGNSVNEEFAKPNVKLELVYRKLS